MNREQLSDAIGRLDEELVGAAMAKRRRPWWVAAVAVAACVALVIGAVTVWPTLTGEENRPPLDVATQPTTVTTDGVDGWPTDATLPEDTTANTTPSDTTAPIITAKPADKTTTAKPADKTTAAKPVSTTNDRTMKSTTTTAVKRTTKTTSRVIVTPPTVRPGGPNWTKTTMKGKTTNNYLPSDVSRLAYPIYPSMMQRPSEFYGDGYTAWKESLNKQMAMLEGHTDGMSNFYNCTISTFLSGKEGENRVYSPLNVYLALSMLAETAEGESRQQILDLLGVSNIGKLREKSHALWNGVYLEDGAAVCRLANSLWLAKGPRWQYDEATVALLAENYYASVYEGTMGSAAYNKELREWITWQSDGLLEKEVENLDLNFDTVFALASTICLRARWNVEFEDTQTDVFYTAEGKKSCKYLIDQKNDSFWRGENFTAISRYLDNMQYRMWFFRPDEDVSADDLIWDKQVLDMMQGNKSNVVETYETINMSIPQFDVAFDQDLTDGLSRLGVIDVFNSKTCNLGGILKSKSEPVMVDKVQHAVRVKIDKKGIIASAGTIIVPSGSAKPKKPIEFKLNRPFVFAITGPGNTILFTGVVENP